MNSPIIIILCMGMAIYCAATHDSAGTYAFVIMALILRTDARVEDLEEKTSE